MKFSKAIVLTKSEDGSRLIVYNGMFYTVFGRMFAVRGNRIGTDWAELCNIKNRYSFQNFNTLEGMFLDN